jgi:hypothetical protein
MAWDMFLAHAGADKARAQELYRCLSPELKVFLDCESLLPGDQWDREIPKAQRQALVTVILVSRAAEAAYYLREEIAAAIALHRTRPDEHRAIPVYLDGMPREPMEIPYGLRILHGIDLPAEGGMPAVARKLKETVAKLQGKALPPAPVAAPPPAGGRDGKWLYNQLCKLMPAQFDTWVFLSGLPSEHIPTSPAPIAMRALSAVQLLQQGNAAAWAKAMEALRQVAPGLEG